MGGLAQRTEHRDAVNGNLCIASLLKGVEQAPSVGPNPKVFAFGKVRP